MVVNKIKPILPSLREKKRYIVFEVLSKSKIGDAKTVSDAINKAFNDYVGIKGMSKAGVLFLSDKYDANKQIGVIKINNKSVDDMKMSLMSIKNIDKKEIIIKTKGVSGILKKAIDKFG